MNDWLDYKGSGSSRAYSGDYTDSTMTHGLRDNIDKTIGSTMDKLTGAAGKRRESEYKQKEAENRLKQSQIRLKAKEIYDAAGKLRGDAADVRQEGLDYHAKIRNGWNSLVTQKARAKDPRALAQLDSAKRNISNDILRTEEKIKTKIAALYKELSRIEKMYNDFTYTNPTSYVKNVPDMLEDSKKYLNEATTLTNEFITNSNKNIW